MGKKIQEIACGKDFVYFYSSANSVDNDGGRFEGGGPLNEQYKPKQQ